MAEGDGKTVLVTGGSGYLATWCIVDLLQRGIESGPRSGTHPASVMSTPRSESQVGPGPHLTVHQADLTSDEHWDNVIEGCDYVLHVASPFPPKQLKDPDELIVPAREGICESSARRSTTASSASSSPSIAAVRLAKGAEKKTLTEEDWTDPDEEGLAPTSVRRQSPSGRPGTRRQARRRGRLAVVNPGAIIGRS
jgi:dihydroflavonol-4-reductase